MIQGRGSGVMEQRDIDFSHGREELVPRHALKARREVTEKLRAMADSTAAELKEYDNQIVQESRSQPFRFDPSYGLAEYEGSYPEDDQSNYINDRESAGSWADQVEREYAEEPQPACAQRRSKSAGPRIQWAASRSTNRDARAIPASQAGSKPDTQERG